MSNKVLVLAEIGHNHNGNLRLAKLMIEEAKKCKADVAKFQLYDIDTIKQFYQSRYAEMKFAQLTYTDMVELKQHCDKVGIDFMASAFDPERVKWLEDVNVKYHKLASRSIRDEKLIKAMEATGKPIITSLGDWSVDGKDWYENKIVPTIENAKFLYCVAEYPATITNFPDNFDNVLVGFSDHTIGIDWAKRAVQNGATIIEKHFTLDKRLPGHNQEGSCDPTELKDLIQFIRQYERQ